LGFPLTPTIINDHIRLMTLEHILSRRSKAALAAKYPHLPQLAEINPTRLVDVFGADLLYDLVGGRQTIPDGWM
jgi:hypothetical protein